MRTAFLISVAVFAALAWIGIDWYRSKDALLSEAPAEKSVIASIETGESIVSTNILIGFDTIKAALNDLGTSLAGKQAGREEIGCIRIDLIISQIRECAHANWSVRYSLDGNIGVARDGDMMRLTVPLKFNGRVRISGALARILQLDKAFEGSFRISAAAAVALDHNFCPEITPGRVTFVWMESARIQVIGRTDLGIGTIGPYWLDIGDEIDDIIRDAAQDAFEKEAGSIPCEPVREELAKIWRHYSFPINMPSVPPLFVNVEPNSLGSPGLLFEDDGLRLLAQMGARTVVSDDKGSEALIETLPKNSGAEKSPGRIDLVVPIALRYGTLETETLRQMPSEHIELKTDAGVVVVEPINISIYPSGDRIAVGLEFSANLPWRLFNTQGTIWLTARPLVEGEGSRVRFVDVELTRQTDSVLWNALTLAFRDRIADEIESAAVFDLAKTEAQAVEAIKAAILEGEDASGIKFGLTNIDIALGRIGIGRERLAVEVLFRAIWTATLSEIKI